MSGVSKTVRQILNEAVNGNINNYTIKEHDKNKKGDGYLGDMCFVSLKEKHGDKYLEYVVKQALSMEEVRILHPIRGYFLNEIHFYTVVWPHFQKFQNEKLDGKAFDAIPQCVTTSSEDKHETLVLENLKFQGFQMHNKAKPLSKDQVDFIFKQYGRFHAISFAYKFFYPEEYSEISSKLTNFWRNAINTKLFREFMDNLFILSLEFLDPDEDSKVIKKYKIVSERGMEVLNEKSQYKGSYSVVLHGDCWSNNMMFKYDESDKLTDLRLLDFQFSNVGTPVSDLSYFLYSGATKEVLDDLDYYLRVYHESLTKTLHNFGCNSQNIYPFEVLKRDWKEYCKTGFGMALAIWKAKFTDQEDVKDLQDFAENTESGFFDVKYDKVSYRKTVRNLILHLYNNDFL